jgi:hypothetical protein
MAIQTFYDSFKSQSGTIVPIFLSGILFISLNTYTLIQSDSISDETNTRILYVELVCSFITSAAVLLFTSRVLYEILGDGLIFKKPYVIVIPIVLLLTTPFSLTIIKGTIENREYVKYLSISSILSAVLNLYTTFVGAFHGTA